MLKEDVQVLLIIKYRYLTRYSKCLSHTKLAINTIDN